MAKAFRFAVAGCLCAVIALPAVLQPMPACASSPSDYFEICRRFGYLPGTWAMRRCIEAQRAADIDPLSGLRETPPKPTAPTSGPYLEESLPDKMPGAQSAEELLKSSPEHLLLGPDWRAPGQGIYE